MKREELTRLIETHGLARHRPRLEELVLPSILIDVEAADGHVPPGASRIGGLPDLPSFSPWPASSSGQPLSFIAQFSMVDVAAHDSDHVLPDRGMLYFFYDSVRMPWGFDPADRGLWSVIYFDGDAGSLAPADLPPGLADESIYTPCRVGFRSGLTLPPPDSAPVAFLGMSDSESNAYCELLESLPPGCGDTAGNTRLLGYPEPIQDPNMHVECQLASNGIYVGDPAGYQHPRVPELAARADNWRLLLQVDSIDEAAMMWGDAGMLYYWIESDALARRDFSNAWLILQCF